MIDPSNPAPYCGPCRAALHVLCEGWLEGFCSCTHDTCLDDLTDDEGAADGRANAPTSSEPEGT